MTDTQVQPPPDDPAAGSLCVDFDGVIHAFETPFVDPEIISDPPVEGALQWLMEMTHHFKVYICSARGATDERRRADAREAIRRWLAHHWQKAGYRKADFGDPITVVSKKPAAALYVDDRGWRFEGPLDFQRLTPSHIKALAPWNRKAKEND